MKWNYDAVDEATNNTTESPVFFCSVNDTSAAAQSQKIDLVFFFFLMCLRNKIVCHYQHRRPLLFKYYKINATFNSIAMAIPGRVTGNICFGPTKMLSSSTGFVLLSRKPEVVTNIPITNSTVYLSSVHI